MGPMGPMEPHGAPWGPMGLHGGPIRPHGPMGAHEAAWAPKEPHEGPNGANVPLLGKTFFRKSTQTMNSTKQIQNVNLCGENIK